MRVRPSKASNETLTVLRFHKPIGVLRALLFEGVRRFMLVGNSSKRSDPLEEIPSKDMSEIELST